MTIPKDIRKYINDNLVCERTVKIGTDGIHKFYWYEIKIKNNKIWSTYDELESNITAEQMKADFMRDLTRGLKNNWGEEKEYYDQIVASMKEAHND